MNTRPATDTPAPSVGPRRLAAIAFVDIAGYSVLMAEDETATHARWMSLLNGVLRPQAALYRGKSSNRPATAFSRNFRARSTRLSGRAACSAQSRYSGCPMRAARQ